MFTKQNIPSPRVRAQIAVKANVSVATVYRYFVGKQKTMPLMAEAIRQAAAKILADAEQVGGK